MKKLLLYLLPLFTAILLAVQPATAQEKGASIQTRFGNFTPLRTPAEKQDFLQSGQEQSFIATLKMNPGKTEIAQLAEKGYEVQQPLYERTFIVYKKPDAAVDSLQMAVFEALVPLTANLKADTQWLARFSGEQDVIIVCPKAADIATFHPKINQTGATVKTGIGLPKGFIQVSATPAQVQVLLVQPWVLSIGGASKNIPLNMDQRGYSGAARQSSGGGVGYNGGLDGAGVVVGVGDNNSGIHLIDLKDKIINFNPAAPTNHGAHVNGTVGGAGIIDPNGTGMAPGAVHVAAFYDYVLSKTPELHQGYEMTVTNNSYAAEVGNCANAGKYDVVSQITDEIADSIPEVLHVFAVGNDGQMNCTGTTPIYSNVPGGFQPAKNVLVVGNVMKNMVLRPASSKGPVNDGRMKPEICAFGTDVYSPLGNNSYAAATGSSMAAPAISGAAALLTQRYKQLHNRQPSALFLKTLLAATADDLGARGPDYRYGLGIFNLDNALASLQNQWYDTLRMTIGGPAVQTFTVNVPAGLSAFKATLCWSEPAAALLAPKALLNDFDLTVTDPQGNVVQSLALNPQNPDAVAVPGADRLNNLEQLLIDAPLAGNYTIRVSRFSQTTPDVPAALVYDFVPDSIRIRQPFTNMPVAAGKPLNVYWSAPAGNGPYTVEFSANGGASWTTLGTVPDAGRSLGWQVPAVTTTQARLRITGNRLQASTGDFTVHVPPVISLANAQCAGYANLQWTSVTGATAYEIFRKIGPQMRPVDTVTDSFATIYNLPIGREEWFAVRPLFGNRPGFRSLGILHKTDSVRQCSFATGDLAITGMASRTAGRLGTKTAFTNTDTVTLKVRNLGAVPVDFRITYRAGNGSWSGLSNVMTIAGGAEMPYPINGLPLQPAGSYPYSFVVENLSISDPQKANDTLGVVLRQLDNPPVNLGGYLEDFESSARSNLTTDSVGMFGGQRWDYDKNDSGDGRMRNFVDSTITLSGNRSVSLDATKFTPNAAQSLTGTFNLAAYDAQLTEIRLEFNYMLHGMPHHPENTAVYFRSSDTSAWQKVFAIDTSLDVGFVRRSGSISLSDVLRTSGQRLTTSAQLRIRQSDTTVIAAKEYGSGFTIDDIRLYSLGNDVALVRIDTPRAIVCSNASVTDFITLVMANGTQNPQYQVPVFYRVDSGTAQLYVVPFLGPKDTLRLRLPYTVSGLAYGRHVFNAWLVYPPDVYGPNDSIRDYEFYVQPTITRFPYLENFEASNGNWYASGVRSSWEYGTPSSTNILKAASGKKVWKTGLASGYNNNEKSYLSSPCIDLTGLQQPYLSMSIATDLEDCGNTLCDQVYVEYSTDNSNWRRLGLSVEGYNWYDSLQHRAWTAAGQYRWRVATTPLPPVDGIMRLRFVMQSDPSSTREGVAIDDIHIYNYEGPIYHNRAATVSQNIAPSSPAAFRFGGKMLGKIFPTNAANGAVSISSYLPPETTEIYFDQPVFPRSFKLQTPILNADSSRTELYLTDADFLRFRSDPACAVCGNITDAYSLGMLRYRDNSTENEDSLLRNNLTGTYFYQGPETLTFIPYDSGYAVGRPGIQTGEYWFVAQRLPPQFAAPDSLVRLFATRFDTATALVRFESEIDTTVNAYYLIRRTATTNGDTIQTFTSRNSLSLTEYRYEDEPRIAEGDTAYYQVRWMTKSGYAFRTPYKPVYWQKTTAFSLYPNPVLRTGVQLRFLSTPAAAYRLAITDVSGKTLYTTSGKTATFDTILEVPISLASGVYFVRLEIEGKTFIQKLVAL